MVDLAFWRLGFGSRSRARRGNVSRGHPLPRSGGGPGDRDRGVVREVDWGSGDGGLESRSADSGAGAVESSDVTRAWCLREKDQDIECSCDVESRGVTRAFEGSGAFENKTVAVESSGGGHGCAAFEKSLFGDVMAVDNAQQNSCGFQQVLWSCACVLSRVLVVSRHLSPLPAGLCAVESRVPLS